MSQYDEKEPSAVSENSKEWKLIQKTLLSMQDEQRKQRRWATFFKVLTFAYLFFLLFMISPGRVGESVVESSGPHVALIEVSGMIAANAEASADNIVTALRSAFKEKNAKAVLLRINSPGGSPVQANYVYQEVMRQKGLHPEKKVYAVISDLGASGAYYIAAAADEIYADKSSIVGSIGVIMSGFGFDQAIEKLGVDRRLLTAGENKALMDPFSPVDDAQQQHVQDMLNMIHAEFIRAVQEGRGERLNDKAHPEIFSGLFWTGEQAKELGLVDGFGSAGFVSREVIGEENLVDYTRKPHPLDRILKGFGASIGAGVADYLLQQRVSLQ